ncbi:flavin reductase family protein [Verrucosispora sp. WMMD573]|uniref:flavin reductase family protein n=1 Tax=Verrucosispora sp. WMMD573 TaxID=3015149 RepID=UPI00248C4543|nr:flavin reductase family protein [Verrucosispora sp. WMMD573]WBB53772.1 flavin reductase family protein [Verrucosispora sp. WMMD573]
MPERAAAALPAAGVLRGVLGEFVTGVTVLTVGGPIPHGMTANSFTSVSLDPPLVLLCVRRDSLMFACLADADGFGISVLAAGQEHLARHFADRRRRPGRGQFAGVGWSPGEQTSAPLLHEALAWLECRPWRCHDGGDHYIVVGRLVAARAAADRDALTFRRGRFGRYADPHPAGSRQHNQPILREAQ